MGGTPVPTGRAKVFHVVRITGRGWALVLDNAGFEGCIQGHAGVVRGEKGASLFSDVGDTRNLDGTANLVVFATAPDAEALFAPGDVVEFLSADP